MSFRKRISVSLASGLAAASFASAAADAAAPSQPVHGGTVVEALGPLVDINWYFPLRPVAYNSTYDALAAALMYKGLFHLAPNGSVMYSRSIASSIQWNPQGTVYTVKMNPKWRWSNGQSVTAGDVAFTWDLIKASSSPTAPAPWPFAGVDSGGVPNDIKLFRVINSHEFQITLTKPVNQEWFLYNGLSDFQPLPAAVWDKYPTDMAKELAYIAANGNNPAFFSVVDGPFRMLSAVQNQAWTFVPNPNYDGHKAYIDRFVLQYETSDTSEVNGLKTGAVQVGYLPSYMYGSRSQLTHDRLAPEYGFVMDRTILNFKSPTAGPIFRQLPVRQALQMGIDQQAIIKDLYNGFGVFGTGPVPLHPSTFLDPELKKPVYPFNPAAGKALLEKNGWREVNGVMQNSKGQKLSFEVQYVAGSTTTTAMAQLMQQDWALEGIQVKLFPVPFATMLHYHRQPTKWEIQTGLGWGYGPSYPSGGGLYSTGGGYNFYGYSNPVMDRLVHATHLPHATPAQAQKALDAYQLFAARNLPNLYMPVPEGFSEIANNVHGVVRNRNPFSGGVTVQYWWVN